MTVLYCDCFSGISGDMFLAALIDAGLPVPYLSEQLARLGLPGFKGVKAKKVLKGAVQATFLEFELEEEPEAGHSEAHHHHHHHRHLGDILELIAHSSLPEAVQQTARDIFMKLAEAEAGVHGTSIEEVHFHEVGAVDSILDIVGASIGIHYFKVGQVYASALPLGSGQVKTQHGLLPLPAPATLALLTAAHAPVVSSPATQELVTPTGAAILSTLARFEQPAMQLQAQGTGAGGRDLPWPNILRVFLGDETAAVGEHVEIETNIDDMNPQFYGHVLGRLFELGALDVYFTPITMKKNRPAIKLSVIARHEDELKLSNVLLRETSTLGVRVTPVRRHEADREFRKIATSLGEAVVKLKKMDGKIVQVSPEYDVCVRLADEHGLPVAQVYNMVLRAAGDLLGD
jgi:uncharacterized protein (TIGR00299 family) protein